MIYDSDFNTDYRGKDNKNGYIIASRIECDYRREKKLYESNRQNQVERNK